MSNITQIVNVDKNMTKLKQGVIASGLNKILSETGPYTIFAPSDKAFGKLEKGAAEELFKPESKVELIDVLNSHVVPGKVHFKDLKDGLSLKALSGKQLKVVVKGDVITINGSQIQGQEVHASNGFVYSLDTVMMKN